MSDQQKYRFAAKHIAVGWDERLCIHIAEGGQSEGELLVGGRQPCGDPNLAPAYRRSASFSATVAQ